MRLNCRWDPNSSAPQEGQQGPLRIMLGVCESPHQKLFTDTLDKHRPRAVQECALWTRDGVADLPTLLSLWSLLSLQTPTSKKKTLVAVVEVTNISLSLLPKGSKYYGFKMRKLRHISVLGWNFGIWSSTELGKKAGALSSRICNPDTRDLVRQSPSCNMLFDKIVKIRARAHFMLFGETARKNFVFHLEKCLGKVWFFS